MLYYGFERVLESARCCAVRIPKFATTTPSIVEPRRPDLSITGESPKALKFNEGEVLKYYFITWPSRLSPLFYFYLDLLRFPARGNCKRGKYMCSRTGIEIMFFQLAWIFSGYGEKN